MALRFDHLGVVVPTLKAGRDHFSAILKVDAWTEEFTDPVNDVYVQFGLDQSGLCYELVAPFGEASPVARALKTGNRILNHIAYLTDDLDLQAEELRDGGYVPIGAAKAAIAYGNRRIQFFLSPLRFVLELIESIDHQHKFKAGL